MFVPTPRGAGTTSPTTAVGRIVWAQVCAMLSRRIQEGIDEAVEVKLTWLEGVQARQFAEDDRHTIVTLVPIVASPWGLPRNSLIRIAVLIEVRKRKKGTVPWVNNYIE
jgi:hypothetical protein